MDAKAWSTMDEELCRGYEESLRKEIGHLKERFALNLKHLRELPKVLEHLKERSIKSFFTAQEA